MNWAPSLRSSFRKRGMTLVEVVVSGAILSMTMACLAVGISTIQRTFRASQHHVKSQIEQARLMDYVSKDLRRALTVSVDTYLGSERLNVTIPDFYEPRPSGAPPRRFPGIADIHDVVRNPVIAGRTVNYGTTPVQVRYYKNGSTIYREYSGTPSVLVTDVQDFSLDFADSGKQTVQFSVTFLPKFRLSGGTSPDVRDATTATATTLLRNKRR